MNIILFGAPGSGKGTLSKNLIKKIDNLVHLAPGDLLRHEIANNTKLAVIAKEYIDQGLLVPDELIFEINTQFMKKYLSHQKGFLFDGYPRSVSQNNQLVTWLENHKQTIDYVFFLKIDFKVVKDRILNRLICENCGAIYNLINNLSIIANKCDFCHHVLTKRNDDNLETIKKRFDTYLQKTDELINLYKNFKHFYEINADSSEEEITKRVLNIIHKIS